jgi:hypothetical protein
MNERESRLQAASIFRRAAAYIRRYGWQERGMSRHGQPRCSMGALESAQPGKWDPGVSELMYSTLTEELRGLSLTQFNHRKRSGEAVARLYERAATSLTGQAS